MADDIIVRFGAQLEGLLTGVAQARESIEGLRAPVEDFVSGLKGIAEVIGAAFVVEKIKEFAEEISRAALETKNMAAAVGTTIGEMKEFQDITVAVGGSADGATRTLERLGRNMSQAITQPTAQAARGFQALSITTEQLKEKQNDLGEVLDLLRQKFSQYADSPAKTAIGYAILGRGFDKLLPVLNMTDEQFAQLKQRIDETGATMSTQMLTAAAATAVDMNILGLAVEGVKNALYEQLLGAINATVASMTEMLEALRNTINGFNTAGRELNDFEVAFRIVRGVIIDVISILDILARALNIIKGSFEAWGRDVGLVVRTVAQSMVTEWSGIPALWDAMLKQMEAETATRGAEMVTQWQAIVNDIKAIIAGGTSSGEVFGPPMPPAKDTRPPAPRMAPTGAGKKGTDDRLQQWRDELRQQLQDEQHFFNDSKQEELSFWQAKLALVRAGSQEDIKLRREINGEIFKLQKDLARQAMKDKLDEITNAHKLDDEDYNYRKTYFEGLKSIGKMSAVEELKTEQMLLDDKLTALRKFFDAKEAAAAADSRKLKEIQDQEATAYKQWATERLALDNKAAEASKQAWDDILSPITSAIQTSIDGMIQGTQTLQQALQKLAQSMLADFVSFLAKRLEKWLAEQLAESAIGAGLKTLGLGFLFSGGGVVPSVPSARGGWSVPSFQGGGTLSMLHANEMVLPENISQGLQAMIAGGGGTTINISAIDAQSFHRFAMNNSSAFVSAVNRGQRLGTSPRIT